MEIGRFAPSPSGDMHLGNALSALLAWLDAKSVGGRIVLRIEDLDPDRCSREKAERVAADLAALGLAWDEGGVDSRYMQSERSGVYQAAFERLAAAGLVYPCFCTRAERLAANAPHANDGTPIYAGRCRDLSAARREELQRSGRRAAWRVRVPDCEVGLIDGNLGAYRENLARDSGDFIIRRSDGVYAYQLAVVVDDALMGVSRVVRGRDLLSSAPRQLWLYEQLGYQPPRFFHLPLLVAPDGRRLAKRDGDLTVRALLEKFSPEEIIGRLAYLVGLQEEPVAVSPVELLADFDWRRVKCEDICVSPAMWDC